MTSAAIFCLLNIAVSIAVGMTAHALGTMLEFEPSYAVAVGCGTGGAVFGSMFATYLMDVRRV